VAAVFLRLPQVLARVGLCATRWYQLVGDGDAPQPIRLGERSVAWLESEVETWMQERAARPRVRILTRSKLRAAERKAAPEAA
jgi:prophage regulatory protein